MQSAHNHAPVLIVNSHSNTKELRISAGMSCLLVVPLAISAFRSGELGGLFFLALPASAIALARLIERTTPEHAAVLYSDRLEIPLHAKQPLVVAWSDVTSICWPKNPVSEQARIRIAVRKDVAQTTEHADFNLNDVSPADQLIVVEYLRRAAAGLEQQNWGDFSQKRAVPLAKAAERRRDCGADTAIAMPRWLRGLEPYPFLGGLLMPVLMGPFLVYALPKLVSRPTYWILAAVIAASAFINIRLFWGAWASPFTEICLGTAAVCLLLGVFAAPEHLSKAGRSTSLPVAIAWYVPALIVCPLFLNATAIGWMPRPYDAVAAVACFVIYLGAAFVVLRCNDRRREKQAESLRADAACRWEVYEITGRLPPAPETDECD